MKVESAIVGALALSNAATVATTEFELGALRQSSGRGVSLKEKLAAVEYDELPVAFRNATETIVGIDYSELSGDIRDWIQEHPYQTAFYVTNGIVLIAPGLVTTPILGLVGFGSLGSRAASIASAYQATLGNVPKGAIFALLQSAGAGGAGLGVVNGVAQKSALLGTTVMAGKAVVDSKVPLIEPDARFMDSGGEEVDLQTEKAKL
ncbi:hypothetical protein MMC18_000254 [Xylographa bjoerkii]|nr:hypothetical protein [Xylographa bjoerkii]